MTISNFFCCFDEVVIPKLIDDHRHFTVKTGFLNKFPLLCGMSHAPPTRVCICLHIQTRRGSRIFERGGGGPGADTGFFTSTPPLDIVRVTSSALGKIEIGHSQKGGPTLGPMLKSLHRGPKGGGGRTPWTPLDPPLQTSRDRSTHERL